jgi:glycosyltransferase involved in cell wall biosynthesis
MKGIRVLFLPIYGPEGPSSRLRVYQYIQPLAEAGIDAEVIIPPKLPGRLGKLLYLGRILARSRQAEVIFLQKQTLAWGLSALARVNPRIIYDFDDAVFTQPPWESSPEPRRAERLQEVLRRSRAVVAGNAYLADYARAYCPMVTVIPTGVDLDSISREVPERERSGPKTVVGWTGTRENLWYLEQIREVVPRVSLKFGEGVAFQIISNGKFEVEGIPIANIPWSLPEEYTRLAGIDIGWAPLGDDPWSRGKCGFKAIQYMALGIAPVAARAGVYPEIISEGENGFLAAGLEEWEEKTGRLIREVELRKKIGAQAREVVRERYSREGNLSRLAELITQVARGGETK